MQRTNTADRWTQDEFEARIEELLSEARSTLVDRKHAARRASASREWYGKASLGCTADEVKSLLYARQLPMTATGRKRPILHLVASHRRRLREGIDIDIKPFLRGVAEVTMDGTRFKVRAPAMEGESA